MKTLVCSLALLLCLPAFSQHTQSFTVHFDFDKHALTPAARASLDSFISILQSNTSDLSIELNGHCDAIGSNAYNDALSNKRVAAVKNYLLKNNIAAGSFTAAEGFGKRKPLNSNADSDERSLNRRVEIAWSVTTAAVVPVTPVVPVAPVVQKTLQQQLEDTAIKVGSSIVLKNLLFVGGRHQLLPESYPVLEELLRTLQKNKNLKIAIQGHICCLPGNVDGFDEETGTNTLSTERAKAVWAYLVKNNIAEDRLSYVGLGHTQPVYAYPEQSEGEKTGNRRVEIKIVGK
ncbi:OmpA family protein [Ferruginibacter sp.]